MNFIYKSSINNNIVSTLIKKYLWQSKTNNLNLFLQELMVLGFEYSSRVSYSLNLEDLKNNVYITPLVKPVNRYNLYLFKKVFKDTLFNKNIIAFDIFLNKIKQLTVIPSTLDIFLDSGARSTTSQIKQIISYKGYISNSSGYILKYPIMKSLGVGLNSQEYFLSLYGARKGIIDTALRTAESGYLTRKLVESIQKIIITEKTCSNPTMIKTHPQYNITVYGTYNINIWKYTVLGYSLAKDYIDITTNIVLFNKNQLINTKIINFIYKNNLSLFYFSPLSCENFLCQRCYGVEYSSGKLIKLGTAVGVIAGQSIGEPGTQFVLRTFHTGGVFNTYNNKINTIYNKNNIIKVFKYFYLSNTKKLYKFYNKQKPYVNIFNTIELKNNNIFIYNYNKLISYNILKNIQFVNSKNFIKGFNTEIEYLYLNILLNSTNNNKWSLYTTNTGCITSIYKNFLRSITNEGVLYNKYNLHILYKYVYNDSIFISNYLNNNTSLNCKYIGIKDTLININRKDIIVFINGYYKQIHIPLKSSLNYINYTIKDIVLFYKVGYNIINLIKKNYINISQKNIYIKDKFLFSKNLLLLYNKHSLIYFNNLFIPDKYLFLYMYSDINFIINQNKYIFKSFYLFKNIKWLLFPHTILYNFISFIKKNNILNNIKIQNYLYLKYITNYLNIPQIDNNKNNFINIVKRGVKLQQGSKEFNFNLKTKNKILIEYPLYKKYIKDVFNKKTLVNTLSNKNKDIIFGIQTINSILENQVLFTNTFYSYNTDYLYFISNVKNNFLNIFDSTLLYFTDITKYNYYLGRLNKYKTIIPLNIQSYYNYSIFYPGKLIKYNIPKWDDLLTSLFYSYYNYNGVYKSCRLAFLSIQVILIKSLQSQYFFQNINIPRIHFELIIKQMTSYCKIINVGDINYNINDIYYLQNIHLLNLSILKHGYQPTFYVPIILGITKCILAFSGFLSTSSFQETLKKLSYSALNFTSDWLIDLKSQVLTNEVINVGSGFSLKSKKNLLNNSKHNIKNVFNYLRKIN
uniref:DNA-directed RNA polymerase n=1 Tax=Piridium sociabile TaxID=2570542 RepID=A0A5B9XV10_9ALVE|nr:RNA polymerase b''-subunit [Piridium sociabile]